ncbi:MAG: restriction endonuclease subunit S [Gammaproteobacteria bacterium]
MNYEWNETILSEIANINPKRHIEKGSLSPFIEMAALPIYSRDVPASKIVSRIFTGGGSKFKDGDTLLARITPCLENGKTVLVYGLGESVHAHGSTEFIVLEPKVLSDARYLYYLIRNERFRKYAIARMEGTSGRQRVPSSAISKYKFICPQALIREKIGDILGVLDDHITLLHETNATLEAIAQTLFKSWFVNFDPVHAKAEGRKPEGIDTETAMLFPSMFTKDKLGIPINWKVVLLGDWLYVLETGKRPKGGVGEIKEGIPSIGAESIVRVGKFNYSKTKYVSREFFAKMKAGVLQSHDILLYKDGGKPGVFLPRVSLFGDGFPFKQCVINEHVFRIRIKEPFNQAFLYFWLWSDATMHELKHRGGKAAIPGINQSDVKELKILMPSKTILDRFNDLVSPLFSQILNNAKQIQTLDTLRDTLLPRLVSGQLRLPETDAGINKVAI